jgi:hypothetical protein
MNAASCCSALWLYPTPKPVEFTAIAFRWSAFTRRLEMGDELAILSQLQPQFPALLFLTVERLRERRRTAHITQQQDPQLEVTGVILHLQHVTDADLARSLGWLSIARNPTEFARLCSERARLEEAGGPEPLVHSHVGHSPIIE